MMAISMNDNNKAVYYHKLKQDEQISWEKYTVSIDTAKGNTLFFPADDVLSGDELEACKVKVDKLAEITSKNL